MFCLVISPEVYFVDHVCPKALTHSRLPLSAFANHSVLLDIDRIMTVDNENHEEVPNKEESDLFDTEEGKPIEGMGKRKRFGGKNPNGLPATSMLSDISKKYDVDGDGKLDAAEQAMRDMDTENRGHLSNEKVYKLMLEEMKLQKKIFGLKRILRFLAFVMVVLSLAMLGTSFAAATLAKDTNVVNGNLVVKEDGSLVATRSRGSRVVATVDMEYVRRLRRRMFGIETPEDRRLLQEGIGELVAKVPSQQVRDAIFAFEQDGTPIAVTASIYGVKFTELGAGSGLSISEKADEDGVITTWYRGLHAQEKPEPTYDVHCGVSDDCEVYQIGDIGAYRRMNDDEEASRRLVPDYVVYWRNFCENNFKTESECGNYIVDDRSKCTWDQGGGWCSYTDESAYLDRKFCSVVGEGMVYSDKMKACENHAFCFWAPNHESCEIINALSLVSGPRQESFVNWAVTHFLIVLVGIPLLW
jgi:hypothetical protein